MQGQNSGPNCYLCQKVNLLQQHKPKCDLLTSELIDSIPKHNLTNKLLLSRQSVEMSSRAKRQCSSKLMVDHMCLNSPDGFCMYSNGITCDTHYIVLTSLVQISTFFHICSCILKALSILHRISKKRLICFWTCSYQISGKRALKNYEKVGRKL